MPKHAHDQGATDAPPAPPAGRLHKAPSKTFTMHAAGRPRPPVDGLPAGDRWTSPLITQEERAALADRPKLLKAIDLWDAVIRDAESRRDRLKRLMECGRPSVVAVVRDAIVDYDAAFTMLSGDTPPTTDEWPAVSARLIQAVEGLHDALRHALDVVEQEDGR